jgi:hypothetical protein
VDASSVAYEWVTLDVEGLGQTTCRSRFNSVPTLGAATLGATLQGEHLSGSLGFGYNRGESDTLQLGSLSTGLVAESKLRVRALSLVCAVSYAF